jgi:DNA-binding XRE family transcriptional regulator
MGSPRTCRRADAAYKQGAFRQHSTLAWRLPDIEKVVGQQIKKMRKVKGLKQDELAERSGLNRAHLYRLENGEQSMTLRTLKLIADTLGVKARDLIGNV